MSLNEKGLESGVSGFVESHEALPKKCRVVVVGGGIAGASVAYHLARSLKVREEANSVVLLEQNRIAGGTTWHAAGLVGRLRTSSPMTCINKYSAELYKSLKEETGIDPGWNECGSVIVARTPERLEQIRRTAAMSALFDVKVEFIEKERIKELWPLMRVDDLLGGAYLKEDGKVIPQRVTEALAKGAADKGVRVFENVAVAEVLTSNGKTVGVKTENGHVISCDEVVLACGMWTRVLAEKCGVCCPLYPVEHHYIITTQDIDEVDENLPVGRDPDVQIYYRSEGKKIMLGAFQNSTRPWTEDIPRKFTYSLLAPDWEYYEQPLKEGKWRIPILDEKPTELQRFVNGPESFTPDNNFIAGETSEVKGLYVLAGFNSVGIASAGGAGKYLADWIVAGHPTLDLTSVDIRRFTWFQNIPEFLKPRSSEVLAIHYQMAWPNRELVTGRNLRQSPLHSLLKAKGACFGQKNGWERPLWFAPEGVEPKIIYTFGKQNWVEYSGLEHQAARESVAVFDQTGFAKLLVKGRHAKDVLQRLCGGNVDVPIGKIVYTGMFNEWKGGFESDFTVLRIASDSFYIVTGTAQGVRDADWVTKHIRENEIAVVVDVTESYGVLGLMGPNSRKLLQKVSDAKLSNEEFPFGTAKPISVGQHLVSHCMRITYVGELGYELHIPTSATKAVYEILWEAGQEFGIRNAGHYAINSLRLEKGYRAFPADIGPEDTPIESGLAFAIDWSKDFIGKETLLAQKSNPNNIKKRLVSIVLESPEAVIWGSEPIYRNGVAVGLTTSAAFGHTLKKPVALGWLKRRDGSGQGVVDLAWIREGTYEVEALGRKWPATVSLQSPYDPTRSKILA